MHIMHEEAGMTTAAADRDLMGVGFQAYPQRQVIEAFVRRGEEAFPEQVPDASIHGDGGIPGEWLRFVVNISLSGFTAVSLSCLIHANLRRTK